MSALPESNHKAIIEKLFWIKYRVKDMLNKALMISRKEGKQAERKLDFYWPDDAVFYSENNFSDIEVLELQTPSLPV